MKTRFNILATCILIATGSCQLTDHDDTNNVGTDIIDPENPPVIQFDHTTYDFGEVVQGVEVKHVFTFINTGKSPLVLASVEPGCGCTATEWSREPISPGEEGRISVVFDSEGRSGDQKKVISVKANTDPSITMIYLTGSIAAPRN